MWAGGTNHESGTRDRFGWLSRAVVTLVVGLVVASSVVGTAGATVTASAGGPQATNPSVAQSQSGSLTQCELTDGEGPVSAVMANGQVRYEMLDGSTTRYVHAIEYQTADGRTQVVGPGARPGWYLFSDQQVLGDREHVAEAIEVTQTSDGRQACVYTTIVRASASNGHTYLIRARTALVGSEQGATTTIRLRNVGDQGGRISTPSGFIEDSIRVGKLELADKSGTYQFHVPGAGTQVFNRTDYWTDYSLDRSNPAVVVFNEGSDGPDEAFAMTFDGGTTSTSEAMTEDGNDPRQNSDTLTYDVAETTLSPRESARWTVRHAALAGGSDTVQRYRDAFPTATGLTEAGRIEPGSLEGNGGLAGQQSDSQQTDDGQQTDGGQGDGDTQQETPTVNENAPPPVETSITFRDFSLGEPVVRETSDLAEHDIAATVRNVSVRSSSGLGEVQVDIRQSADPQSTTSDQPLPNGTVALNYLSIDHSVSNDLIDRVTLTIGVERSVVESLPNTESDEVTVYRYRDGRWQDVEATLVGRDGDEFVYEASAPGFSEWATGAQRPQFQITDAEVNVSTIDVGDELGVQVRITNTGGADGQYTTELLLDDETVESRDVSVASGGTRQVIFEQPLEDPGQYTVLVNDEQAGEIEVEGAAASGGPGGDESALPVVPLAGGGLFLAVLALGTFLYTARE